MKNFLITQTLTFQPDDPPRPLGKYVYQRVAPGKGNVTARPAKDLQLRAHVIPIDPHTPNQVARRLLLAAAVARWHATPLQEREQWRPLANARALTLYMASISDTLTNYHLVNGELQPN
jgi:hypothetical protein